ncbi:LicD family protein [Prochlorococcus marinus]|uniref:LicD family protein n=1 Tax=Prochlorococcus marinus TaxID=1219 RepID=UPI0022B3E2D0|nr:LicD family protein [Prochlorococcus marinus]
MSGQKNIANKLNNTLVTIAYILNKNNIEDWFIAYGTLLGIIRKNSCIENDDDIDIICDNKDFHKLKKVLKENNITLEYVPGNNGSKKIIKTKETVSLSTIDIYMAEKKEKGSYLDLWENILWEACLSYDNNKFIKKEWKGIIINLPYNNTYMLEKIYGPLWKYPIRSKERIDLEYLIKLKFLKPIIIKIIPKQVKNKIKRLYKKLTGLIRLIK